MATSRRRTSGSCRPRSRRQGRGGLSGLAAGYFAVVLSAVLGLYPVSGGRLTGASGWRRFSSWSSVRGPATGVDPKPGVGRLGGGGGRVRASSCIADGSPIATLLRTLGRAEHDLCQDAGGVSAVNANPTGSAWLHAPEDFRLRNGRGLLSSTPLRSEANRAEPRSRGAGPPVLDAAQRPPGGKRARPRGLCFRADFWPARSVGTARATHLRR